MTVVQEVEAGVVLEAGQGLIAHQGLVQGQGHLRRTSRKAGLNEINKKNLAA